MEEELLEQEFLERCFQEMLEEEDQDWFIPSRDLNNQGVGQLQQQLNGLSVSDHHSNLEEVAVSGRAPETGATLLFFFFFCLIKVNFPAFALQRKSILNPEAKEFVPGKKY